MSLKALTTALTLYRGTSLTVEQAATQSGISPTELESVLGAQGVPGADTQSGSRTESLRN